MTDKISLIEEKHILDDWGFFSEIQMIKLYMKINKYFSNLLSTISFDVTVVLGNRINRLSPSTHPTENAMRVCESW
jgi:hypothetical protein